MNRKTLVKNVARQSNVDKETVDLILDVAFGEIKKNLENKIQVHIDGFGRFFVKFFKARKAYDIYNKKGVWIEDRYIPTFRPYFGKRGV